VDERERYYTSVHAGVKLKTPEMTVSQVTEVLELVNFASLRYRKAADDIFQNDAITRRIEPPPCRPRIVECHHQHWITWSQSWLCCLISTGGGTLAVALRRLGLPTMRVTAAISILVSGLKRRLSTLQESPFRESWPMNSLMGLTTR